VLVAVAALFKWLSSRQQNSSNTNDSPETPTPASRRSVREESSSDEEQIRKFLEALGQPRGTKVPPPVPPRTNLPPRPVAPVRPPPSAIPIPEIRRSRRPTEQPQDVSGAKREIVVQPTPPRRSYQPSPPVVPRGEVLGFEMQETTRPAGEVAAPGGAAASPGATGTQSSVTLAQLLRSPGGLRQAVILREVFGPPRSMQPLELTEV
jgi:hypothetical protein